MEDPNRVIFIERWKDNPLPYDDIDSESLRITTASLFSNKMLDQDEDDLDLPMNTATFGSKVSKNRRSLLEPCWMDDYIYEKFRAKPNASSLMRDQTMLEAIRVFQGSNGQTKEEATIALFLAFGMCENEPSLHIDTNDMFRGISEDFSATLDVNNTFSHIRSNSAMHSNLANSASSNAMSHSAQTPRMTRRLSTERNFETPISRIIR